MGARLLRRRIAAAFVHAAVCALAFAACRGEDVKVATLSLYNPTDGGVPRGLDCRDARKIALARRLLDNHGKGSVIIDYLRFGGVLHCRPRELEDWCDKYTCPTIPAARVCIPISIPTTSSSYPVQDLYRAVNALQGRVVTSSAPDGYVLVRLVATSEECGSLGPTFQVQRLAGCLYSCPALLSDGEVSLDLDPTNNDCEDTVDACAGLDQRGPSNGSDAGAASY